MQANLKLKTGKTHEYVQELHNLRSDWFKVVDVRACKVKDLADTL